MVPLSVDARGLACICLIDVSGDAYRIVRKGLDVTVCSEELARQKIREDSSVQSIAKLSGLDNGGVRVEASSLREDTEIRDGLRNTGRHSLEVQIGELEDNDFRFWQVLRANRLSSAVVSEGSTLKLGRCLFKVKRIILSNKPVSPIHTYIPDYT